jgi:hypothetical protein
MIDLTEIIADNKQLEIKAKKEKKNWTTLQWGKPHLTDKQIDNIINIVEENLVYDGRGEDIKAYVDKDGVERIKRKIKIILEG